ncbi:LemA family protein [Rhizobium leguminosarum]|uniref:LemA family protein n=1 Tax=Rhizobium leguminosarum TaxID=384 RepID=UPI002E0E2E64|nr:LemA family protein [Rhizobium leguminosarum]
MGFWIFIAAVVVIAIFAVVVYNRLVGLRQGTKQAFADIDAQLKARADLLPNLVETVKGYAKHERETLDAVISARNAAQRASTPGEAAAAEGLVGASLGRLFAIAESYPDLKANQNFVQLQGELSDLENKIAAARRFLNMAVAEYNGAIQQFPAVLFSKAFGFKEEAMFAVSETEREQVQSAPKVSF